MDCSDESSSEEEEENPNFSKKSTKGFLRALKALKGNDPKIYKENCKFYSSESENEDNSKKSKPMTLKDYDKNVILEKEGQIDEEAEELKVLENQGKSFMQEQKELKESFKKLADEEESEGEEIFTRVAKKQKKEKRKETETEGKL